jgi:hypothetical protein
MPHWLCTPGLCGPIAHVPDPIRRSSHLQAERVIVRRRRRVDWLGLTNLTPSTFADELAALYSSDRMRRADLVGGRFAGQPTSSRFLRERRLFAFEGRAGALRLAIAAPAEDETVRGD